jgi:hypothetical protein
MASISSATAPRAIGLHCKDWIQQKSSLMPTLSWEQADAASL